MMPRPGERPDDGYRLVLEAVELGAMEDDELEVLLVTDGGPITARLHNAVTGTAGIVWIGGARGGLNGPGSGLYRRLGRRLVDAGITSLSLHYRYPNDLALSVLDALLGIDYLRMLGRMRLVLVGHSFGGAVAIAAGAASDLVVGVAGLSSQTYGAGAVVDLSPRSLLLVHGTSDRVLPAACSQFLYARAREPKKMLLYPGCGHDLDECRERLEADLSAWLLEILMAPAGADSAA